MKTALLALVLSLSTNALAATDTYQLSVDLHSADGKTISTDLDVTAWLATFPAPLTDRNLNGEILKTILLPGAALVRIGYYHGYGYSAPSSEKTGSRYNIYDLSVRSPDGKTSYCYNSFYVQDLRETPYVHQTCPLSNGQWIVVDFSSRKFW